MTYGEQLKDPRWQKRRLEILQRDNWTCQECSDNKSTLHVHHRRYVRGQMAWQAADDDLVTLCEGCHEAITLARDYLTQMVSDFGWADLNSVIGFAKGLRHAAGANSPRPVNPSQLIGMWAAHVVFADGDPVREKLAREVSEQADRISAQGGA